MTAAPVPAPVPAPLAFVPADPAYAERVRASFARQGAMKTLGAELVTVAPGYCAIALVPRPAISQQHGHVHGGRRTLIAAMQQTLMVMHGKADE